MDDVSAEEVLEAIEAVARQILDHANLVEPPFDAVQLARDQFHVSVPESEAENVLRREMEQQWNAAKSIADHFRPVVLQRLGLERPPRGKSISNLLTTRLLMPTDWLREDAPALDYDLPALRERYSTVTHETLAWRLLDLDEPCIITIVDDGTIYRRRSNAWQVKKKLSRPEQECRRTVFQSGEPHFLCADGWSVQCWPIPHELWTRQILRSIVEEDALFTEEPTLGDDEPF